MSSGSLAQTATRPRSTRRTRPTPAPSRLGDDEVIIASGLAFPDALAGAALAGSVDGPILLTDPNKLPAPLDNYLVDKKPSIVHILGGPGAVSTAVENEIKALQGLSGVTINRLAGTNRYATAQEVANYVNDQRRC